MEMTMAESKSGKSSGKSGGRSSSSSKKRSSGGGSKSGGRSSSSSTKSKSSSGGSSGGGSKQGSSGRSSGGSRSSSNGKKPREIVLGAAEQLQQLIGRPIEAVLGMEKDGSEWSVAVEVLELERVPNTTDVLGRYEITVDKDGELTAVHRTRRYVRAEAGEG
jgi:hypothetical protein